MKLHQPLIQPVGMPSLEWRPLRAEDALEVAALTHRCLDADGGLREVAVERFLAACDPNRPALATLGVFAPEGLRACASVLHKAGSMECRGQVDPLFRGIGLGHALLQWSLEPATASEGESATVMVCTESLTDEADRMYRRFGLVQVFAEEIMCRTSETEAEEIPLPEGVSLLTWSQTEPIEFFRVYTAAFRERPGFPGWSAERWTEWATGGDDFLPDLSFVVRERGESLGYILCASGWIVQMGVLPSARRRGLGRLLLAQVLQRFRALGTPEIWLDVNVNNPSAAALYAAMGFTVAGRRGRYAPDPTWDRWRAELGGK